MHYSVYKTYTMSLINNLKRLSNVRKYGIESFLKNYLLNNPEFLNTSGFTALWMEDLWKIHGSVTLFLDQELPVKLQSFRKYTAPGLQPTLKFPFQVFSLAFPKKYLVQKKNPCGVLVFWGTRREMFHAGNQYLDHIGCGSLVKTYHGGDDRSWDLPMVAILFRVDEMGLSGRRESRAVLLCVTQDLFEQALAAKDLADFTLRLKREGLSLPFGQQLRSENQELRLRLIRMVISLGVCYTAKGDKMLRSGLPDDINKLALYYNQWFDRTSAVFILDNPPVGGLVVAEQLDWDLKFLNDDKSDIKAKRLH